MKNIYILVFLATTFSCKTNKDKVNIDRELELIDKNSGQFDPAQFEQSTHYGLEYMVVDGKIDNSQMPILTKRSGPMPFKNGTINGPARISIFDDTFKEVYFYGTENPLQNRKCIPDEGDTNIPKLVNGSITLLIPENIDIRGIVVSIDGEKLLDSKIPFKELLERMKRQDEEQPQDTTQTKPDPGRK